MTFWERFFELCTSHGKKPNAVCAELELSNATATHWKNGTMPKGDVLLKLGDYFGVSVDYLLGRSDLPTVDTPLNTELVQNYNLLNTDGKQKVVTYSADLLKIDEYKKELP